ncbi:O-antigen polymerase [Vibrio rumoiensis]
MLTQRLDSFDILTRLTATAIVFYFAMYFVQVSSNEIDIITVSFIILTGQSLFGCFFISKNCSLGSLYFIFSAIFFSIVPMLEYLNGVIYWTTLSFDISAYFIVNYFLIIYNFMFLFVYIYFYKELRVIKLEEFKESINFLKQRLNILFIISLIALFTKLYLVDFSIFGILFRGASTSGSITGPTKLIAETFSVYVPLIIFSIVSLSPNLSRAVKAVFFLFLLINVFPLGNPRFVVASVYIPLFIMLYPKVLLGIRFSILMIFSIVVVFPFLDKFRYIKDFSEFSLAPSFDFFFKGHFDSYQSLLRVVSENYVTWGNQLLGNLFFFIPRSIWPEKSAGSGYTLANDLNYFFSNISMNLFGEGYINFGMIGLILYSVFFLFAVFKLDSYKGQGKVVKFTTLFLFGYLVMVLRGDFLTIYSQLVSVLLYSFILFRLVSTRVKWHNKP